MELLDCSWAQATQQQAKDSEKLRNVRLSEFIEANLPVCERYLEEGPNRRAGTGRKRLVQNYQYLETAMEPKFGEAYPSAALASRQRVRADGWVLSLGKNDAISWVEPRD